MVKITREGKEWVVRDKGQEWKFETYAKADSKGLELKVEKLKQMEENR